MATDVRHFLELLTAAKTGMDLDLESFEANLLASWANGNAARLSIFSRRIRDEEQAISEGNFLSIGFLEDELLVSYRNYHCSFKYVVEEELGREQALDLIVALHDEQFSCATLTEGRKPALVWLINSQNGLFIKEYPLTGYHKPLIAWSLGKPERRIEIHSFNGTYDASMSLKEAQSASIEIPSTAKL